MSVDINNLTGEETAEELEALLNGLGDVDISDDTVGEVTITGQTTADDLNKQQENKGDTITLTPGVAAQPQTTTTQQPAVADEGNGSAKSIISRDGKHTIPYGVLEAERAEKQRLSEANQRASTELAEARRQLEVFTRQINAAGLQPAQLPEKAQITPEQIATVRESFPEVANVLDALTQKVEYLQSAQPTPVVPQSVNDNPVMAALDATAELKSWQSSDPDRFTLAVHIDETLKLDPAWKDKPLAERFSEVEKRTRAAYGETVESAPQQPTQAAQQQPTTAELQQKAADLLAKANASSQLPASPSDVGSTTQHSASPLEQAANADPDQLQAMFAGMTDAQIEALLEQAI
ncbi:hypothetical protein [Pectobacterium parmentieri]|uniref:Phage protein n=1 Tax=Pectobacterium parmentieri TaxID=1905730 RepID=A0A8B3FTX0_PECPM|nr:hypothetical protein [Pectobacterium parmentieri]AOR58828.1 hypothetical protein A8F97_07895 [Pectobacterium parmentieri]AYH10136.1 hypothetical protein C5E24_10815 [Pectobacterium parmentieri]AYH19153.1 hypothetical protein C5E22_11975 [Pectobacterium parmentieri]AYH36455.1 hypothetical protein C5E17_10760 [Pectobacterium parmentieri]AZS56561.1 hypothetical protein C5E18_10760 [Pectobacterium parmentieri]